MRNRHEDPDLVELVVRELWKKWKNTEPENYVGRRYSNLTKEYRLSR